MNQDINKIKALKFEREIDILWSKGNTEPMEKLLEMIDIPYSRDDLMDFGWLLNDSFIDNWGIDETIKRMKSFIPLDKENLNTDSSEGQTCLNKECTFWHSDREPSCYTVYSDCWADIHLYVCIAIKIGGLNALKELRDKWNVDTEVLYTYYENEKGLYEKELYEMNLPINDVVKKHLHQIKTKGDDKMSKPFFKALSELKGEISVFWIENMMYVNDNNDGQATTNTSLFQAYRFASLIKSPSFDYTASDKEVKEFQKKLLEFYKDDFSEDEQQQYIIDVWEYLDDIADDYKKLTGVTINDIDIKRAIVCHMSETDWENNCAMGFGSGTYIARILSDHIIGDERNQVKGCNNPIAIRLAEQYLPTDEHNLKKFAQALHNAVQEKYISLADKYGQTYLWINGCKYESVIHITINSEEVDIYSENYRIGSILRENINTFLVGYYSDYGNDVDINNMLDFDIKKVGDF